MKKETIYAVSLGVLLGLIVAVIMVLILRPSGKQKVLSTNVKTTPKLNQMKKSYRSLEIIQPVDRQMSTSKNIIIKGKAEPKSMIIIESPFGEKIIKNSKQEFQTEFPLALGENLISIRAYINKNQTVPQMKTLQIYYIEEE